MGDAGSVPALDTAESDVHYAGLIPTLTANLLSILGCLWLLVRVQRMSSITRRRLFPRQVRMLAASDLVFHLSSAFVDIVGFSGNSNIKLCYLSENLIRFGTNSSCLYELHLAVSFLLQSAGWPRTAQCMIALLLPVWPVAALLTVVEWFSAHIVQDASQWCDAKSTDYVFVILLAFVFVVCLASYVAAVVVARSWGQAAARRCWWRAAMYPLNFMLTQAPKLLVHMIFFRMASNQRRAATDPLIIISDTMQNLNGFVNTLTYWLQSRYAVKLLRKEGVQAMFATVAAETSRPAPAPHDASFHVRFGGVTLEELLPPEFMSKNSDSTGDSRSNRSVATNGCSVATTSSPSAHGRLLASAPSV